MRYLGAMCAQCFIFSGMLNSKAMLTAAPGLDLLLRLLMKLIYNNSEIK